MRAARGPVAVALLLAACTAAGGPGVPTPDASMTIVCGDRTVTTGSCPAASDAGGDSAIIVPDSTGEAPDACRSELQAVIEPVDKAGRPFARDAAGVYQVPIASDDLAFDAGASRNLSGRDVSYHFSADCFPSVVVSSPVLGGFSARDFGLGRRCQVSLEITDAGCPSVRQAQAQAVLVVVP